MENEQPVNFFDMIGWQNFEPQPYVSPYVRRRDRNGPPPDVFAAIDVETMSGARSSICQIAAVRVAGGVVVSRFCSLVRPAPEVMSDAATPHCIELHGIRPEMLAAAPSFAEVLPLVEAVAGGVQLVAHNAAFDASAIEAAQEAAGLSSTLLIHEIDDTVPEGTRRGLEDCCAEAGIEIGTHHDALCDALACARLYLRQFGAVEVAPAPGAPRRRGKWNKEKKAEHEDLVPLDPSAVERKDTPFFQAKVVYSGNFSRFPDRTEIARVLRSLGADVDTNVTRRTAILVIGDEPGPAKLEKALDCGTRIMPEAEFYSILDGN